MESTTSSESALRPEFLKKKLELVRKEMQSKDIDLWVTFTREGNPDPVSRDLGLEAVVWRSAAIFDSEGSSTAIVGNLDAEAIRQRGIYDEVFGYAKEGAIPKLRDFLKKKSKAKTIAVNTSYDFGLSDGLSPGMLSYFKKCLESGSKRKPRLVSAEDLVISLRAKAIPEELDLLKKSVEACEAIFSVAERDIIKVGKTDKQIHEEMQDEVRSRKLDLAWAPSGCPAVVVGNTPFGHLGFSNVTLGANELIHFDFGVKFEGYCSDLQRVYFVGPNAPPKSVRDLFAATKKATDAAVEALKPGAKAYLADKAARDSVIACGYPEFMHGTGHVVSRATHEIGPLIAPRWRERYGRSMEKTLSPGMVFTIEPSVQGKDGTMNIEREVLLTESGTESFSTPEEELYEL